MTTSITEDQARQSAARFTETFNLVRAEVGKFIVGQHDVVEQVLIAIVCGGHVLLEGVPGLGKTALVTTLSRVLNLQFQRIQFTPDLLPADIVGSMIFIERDGQKVFDFQKGPVFCNLLLADEINRATPKTQSALLETMQEHSVTVAGHTTQLDLPFFVLATQNPIESDGTYPLPEAQLDRFFFKLFVDAPKHDEFHEILNRTGGTQTPEVQTVASGEQILEMNQTLRQVPIDAHVQDHLVHVVRRTHPANDEAPESIRKFVRHGASPRAAQSMLAAARVKALLDDRFHVSCEDVNAVAIPAMRHRLVLSFEGEAEGIRTDNLIQQVIASLA